MSKSKLTEMAKVIKSLESQATIMDPTYTNKIAASFERLNQAKEVSQWKDLKVYVEVVLGSTRLSDDKIASLKDGSIVVFEELADEFVTIYINGKKIAQGRIATVDNHYAIQITEILDKKQRIQALCT